MESRPACDVDAVRLIAVDMDGTFLDANSSYDRERFARLHGHLAERGVQFVVASGHQYWQLRPTGRPGARRGDPTQPGPSR